MVEHDMQVASNSDWVIDIGPGAGDEGGLIVAQGKPEDVAQSKHSRTATFLKSAL
jgi:excinuclease ABC subunit A